MLQSIIKDFRAGKVSTIGQEQWLKSIRPQQKVEWSEEDEKMRNLAIEWAETMSGQFSFVDMDSTDFCKIISWLKSLRPSWKPSEEQMDILNKMTLGNFLGSGQYDILRTLYEDLKKLM